MYRETKDIRLVCDTFETSRATLWQLRNSGNNIHDGAKDGRHRKSTVGRIIAHLKGEPFQQKGRSKDSIETLIKRMPFKINAIQVDEVLNPASLLGQNNPITIPQKQWHY